MVISRPRFAVTHPRKDNRLDMVRSNGEHVASGRVVFRWAANGRTVRATYPLRGPDTVSCHLCNESVDPLRLIARIHKRPNDSQFFTGRMFEGAFKISSRLSPYIISSGITVNDTAIKHPKLIKMTMAASKNLQTVRLNINACRETNHIIIWNLGIVFFDS